MKITANGIDIHYILEGSGPCVTLSHSLACDLSMWDEQARLLARDHTVLRYDTRGHGATSAPPAPYTLDRLADDAHALLTALGIAKTHWVGLSLGGMIGQVFATKYPACVQSLALCDTTSRYPAEAATMWSERIALVRRDGMETVVEPTLGRWFTEPYRKSAPDVMKQFAAMIARTPVEGYAGCSEAICRINVTGQLEKIKCPVLVIVGEQDQGTPPAMAREIHDAIAGSELVTIPSAAHLSYIEQPVAFNRALLRFLQSAAG
ncbi:MAG TPA: 3-oxoadipate enol-lactonase [Burkholderiales bacterium]|nr:3-oxoadipate enol-lactonase [Burkholderiales bacterium]